MFLTNATVFHIQQIKWAQLVGRMWDRCFAVKLPTYQTVLDIENEIQAFENELPVPLNAKVPQTGESPPYLPFQVRVIS